MEGIKRINEMAIGQKDFVLLEIVKYLVSREDMNAYYLNEEKSLKGMAEYIQGELLKEYCKQMNIKDASSHAKEVKYGNKSARCLTIGMSEEKTYELAINYFSKSNKELGIEPEEIKKKQEKAVETKKQENVNISDDEFGSIFGADNDENIEEKKDEVEQISFFSIFQ